MTVFGKLLRKLRIDHDERLYDMAKKIGVSSAFLSAVENGNKAIPGTWVERITYLYDLDLMEADALQRAADESAKSVKIDLEDASPLQRNLASAFARRFSSMTDIELVQFQKKLDSMEKGEEAE